jgi:hypothetical protein
MSELRGPDNAQVLDELWRSWEARDEARHVLEAEIPTVRQRAREQLFETLDITARALA